jgi:MFS family permease
VGDRCLRAGPGRDAAERRGLADRIGRRAIFAVGLAVFTACSALCAVASSPVFLDLARAAQGVGGAAMFAASLALLANVVPER